MQIIDGKYVAAELRQKIAAEVLAMTEVGERPPHLAVLLVGDNPASEAYVRLKRKACEECGIESTLIHLSADATQGQVLAAVNNLNADDAIDGYIVQLPLPDHIDEQWVIENIDPSKDIDGFHPMNVGKMSIGLPGFRPATPQGILMLLEYYNIATRGKHCVVIGRSNIVGKPVASMLLQKALPGNCTVTVCHSATQNLQELTRLADILIVAAGKPAIVTASMVKPGAVVIDVGITRWQDEEGKWHVQGDVDFAGVAPKSSYITPVPGGVGPMTIASLLKNTLRASRRRNKE